MKLSSHRRRVCVVVNSRANYGRIKSVMRHIQAHEELDLQTIVGASALLHRFGEVHKVIEADGFSIDAMLYSIVEGETPTTMAKSTGLAIIELATLFENLQPDIVITVADRFETMATAVAASYMNIPLAHTQGGEVTGSIDESVRHAVTKLAHLHFPATRLSARRLIQMGEDPRYVHFTGCPAIDLIADLDLTLAPDIFKHYKGVGPDIDPQKPYLVVLQHPVTTEYGQGFAQIEQTLVAVTRIGLQAVWLWPNVDAGSEQVAKRLRIFRENEGPETIHFYRNFSPEDYARVIANCACMVGNSSSGIREGAYLGIPAVNIGTRQQGREHGPNILHAGYDSEAIGRAIRRQIDHGPHEPSHIFGDGTAGRKIADILATADLKIQKKLTY